VGRKPFRSADEKLQVVLSVLRGEMTQVPADRGVSGSRDPVLYIAARWRHAPRADDSQSSRVIGFATMHAMQHRR